MDQKKLPVQLAYMPARLSMKKDRWEIVFYQTDPADGIRKRQRETGDLNRIRDLKERSRQAKALISHINGLLPDGYPYRETEKTPALTLEAGMKMAIEIKMKTDRYETKKDCRSIGGVFLRWAAERKVDRMPVTEFGKRLAIEYLDYVAQRTTRNGNTLSNRTWNNYKIKTATFFSELVQREYISGNPFKGISKKTVVGKGRRKCTPSERAEIAAWLWKNDYFCFLAVTLQYYCLFRGTELRRLRAGDFDIGRGMIYLAGEKSKTSKERFVTLPAFLQQLLCDVRFSRIPANYLVFGADGLPNQRTPCGRGYIWRHLRKCLEELKAQGKIDDFEGISPYSFKDTGITDWLQLLPLPEVMKQAGHTNPGTTMIYYQPENVSAAFKGLKSNIFEK